MYLDYFELNEFPFTLTPNTNYYCALPSYNAALDLILISLENGEGFIKIVGEVGIGKTLLCRKLLNNLESSEFITAYIANPNLNSATLYGAILKELGIELSHSKQKTHELLDILSSKLLQLYKEHKHVVVVIDEAQGLGYSVLEELRLLSNIETESSKLLHIVLFGQPELDEHLNKKKMRQLKQRITFSYYLSPLKKQELEDYIFYRLQTAGYRYGSLFSPTARKLLFKASSGIPRLVNVLCHKALLVSYGYNRKKVQAKAMLVAIKDTESVFTNIKKQLISVSIATVLIMVLGFELYCIIRAMA